MQFWPRDNPETLTGGPTCLCTDHAAVKGSEGSITTSLNLPLASHTGKAMKKGLCWQCRLSRDGHKRPTRSDRPVRPVS
ncbi:MAG: hypothetical protein Q9212_001740 [Teloschistes hypoglaucus]